MPILLESELISGVVFYKPRIRDGRVVNIVLWIESGLILTQVNATKDDFCQFCTELLTQMRIEKGEGP